MLFETTQAQYCQCCDERSPQLPTERFDAAPQSGRFRAKFD